MTTAADIVEWEEEAARRLLRATSVSERRCLYASIYDDDNAYWLGLHGPTGISGGAAKNHALLRWACPGAGSILDIGGGSGVAGDAFPPTRRYVVCDASKFRATRPSESLRTFRRTVGTAMDLPFRDAAFQAVLALDVLEHLHTDDIEACLREVVRVLEPGGRFLMATPNALTGPWDSRRNLADATGRLGLHLNELTVGRMFDIAGRSGLRPIAFATRHDVRTMRQGPALQMAGRLSEAVGRACPRRLRSRLWPLAVVLAERPATPRRSAATR